jgi:hypothetical protein
MFRPNVNSRWKREKNSAYQGTPLASVRERRVAVDERGVGDGGVLVPPEPAAAREVQEQVGPARAPPGVFRVSVVTPR